MGAHMNFGAIVKQVFTGPNNQTIAWGRVMGAMVFIVFVVGVPIAALVLLALKAVGPDALVAFLHELGFYVPLVSIAAWSFVTGTGMTEPKPRSDP